MVAIHAFSCPSCHASLEYQDDGAATVRCAFCNATVIVPDMLRQPVLPTARQRQNAGQPLAEIARLLAGDQKISAIKLYRETFNTGLREAKEAVEAMERGEAVAIGSAAPYAMPTGGQPPAGRSFVGLLLLVLLLAGGGFLVYSLLLAGDSEEGGGLPEAIVSSGLATGSSAVPTALPASSLETVLTIGGQEGTGPGFFNDTRWAGVDGQGRIYTGDFEGGRIQVFNEDGSFLTQWFTQGGEYLTSMVADREGIVYTVESGKIYHYNGESGEMLGQWQGDGSFTIFDDLALTADGHLLSMSQGALVRFNPDGSFAMQVPNLLEQLPSDVNTDSVRDLAVDGANNLYLLFTFDNAIYKFDPEGRYVDRFVQAGESSPAATHMALAVDGQGRIFVGDFFGLLVFDKDGRQIDTIELPGVAFALLFDADNNLYRMDRNGNQLLKYRLLR